MENFRFLSEEEIIELLDIPCKSIKTGKAGYPLKDATQEDLEELKKDLRVILSKKQERKYK